jgi:hypothetical protein
MAETTSHVAEGHHSWPSRSHEAEMVSRGRGGRMRLKDVTCGRGGRRVSHVDEGQHTRPKGGARGRRASHVTEGRRTWPMIARGRYGRSSRYGHMWSWGIAHGQEGSHVTDMVTRGRYGHTWSIRYI